MFISYCDLDKKAKVSVYAESEQPVRLGIGEYGEFGVHMTREEALDLMSQLEKAVHSLVAVQCEKWVVSKESLLEERGF